MTQQAAQGEQFWNWFLENKTNIEQALAVENTSWLRENLTSRIQALKTDGDCPQLNWEIGPGKRRKWQLCISPTTLENAAITEAVARSAPKVPDWEFYAYKQPKPRETCFELSLTDKHGELIEVDATNWRFALRRIGNNGHVGILFFAPNFLSVSEDMADKVAWLILDNLLGEEKVLRLFKEAHVFPSQKFPVDYPAISIHELSDVVESV